MKQPEAGCTEGGLFGIFDSMSTYWNDRTRALRPYVAGEQPRNQTYIKLNTNENPYPPSPLVIEALTRAAGESLRRYPDPACRELREAVARVYRVKAEQVFAGNGSDEVLAFAFAAFFPPASGVRASCGAPAPLLFPDITYSFYPVYAALWDVPFRAVPLAADFTLDLAEYRIENSGVIFPNPNAPTGRAVPRTAIARALAREKRVMVVDEAYHGFGSQSAVPLIADAPNLLTVHTLSKSASLAGLRVGFAIGSEELIDGLCRVRDSVNSYTVDRLAQAGGAAAVLDVPYYEKINRMVAATRERAAA
ncbi:MAG: aminotransferase class I/II-fold pyridoxal phosphate-dependent enzyme, partial [Spirochaetaceae bacterium]|nr:aminotransferase class I/II-fold pyridoxal phosphate-dependent enzyme [Spirochaetaceae bacterium]